MYYTDVTFVSNPFVRHVEVVPKAGQVVRRGVLLLK